MNKRIPSLIASVALGVIALTGCSANAGSAAGDLGNRVPMAQARADGNAAASPAATGEVDVTALSADEFTAAEGASAGCAVHGQVTYCQDLQREAPGDSAYVVWTAYIASPQDTFDGTMIVNPGQYAADFHADSRYVKVTWDSPEIRADSVVDTDVQLTLGDGTTYDASCYATDAGDGTYDQSDLGLR
jgi:hypothetical protein